MGACGVEMMPVDYIFRGENLKYIRSYWTSQRALSTSAIHTRAGCVAETLRGEPIGYTEVETAWRPRPVPDSTRSYCIYINPPALTILAVVLPCPTSLTKSLSCTHTAPGLPRASGCYDHWCTRSRHFSCLSHQARTHAPISEHPELVISYVFLRKHVQ
jgi:hypothetical protein